jgi:hypothetical protein
MACRPALAGKVSLWPGIGWPGVPCRFRIIVTSRLVNDLEVAFPRNRVAGHTRQATLVGLLVLDFIPGHRRKESQAVSQPVEVDEIPAGEAGGCQRRW